LKGEKYQVTAETPTYVEVINLKTKEETTFSKSDKKEFTSIKRQLDKMFS